MTLLEATSYLIAWAKDVQNLSGRPNKELSRALKRLEKRLDVLRLRQANAMRRRRQKAWKMVHHLLGDPALCPICRFDIAFGDFVKTADIDYRGHIDEFVCPSCDFPIILLFREENTYMVGRQCDGKLTLEAALSTRP